LEFWIWQVSKYLRWVDFCASINIPFAQFEIFGCHLELLNAISLYFTVHISVCQWSLLKQ
jgi:hypothetical protein